MNEERVEIDGKDYTIAVENDEVVDVHETESFYDTESHELIQKFQQMPNTTAGNFYVHAYETGLQEVVKDIGEAMAASDVAITRMGESRLGENCIYIEWEQPSAMGLYDTPDEPDPKTPEGAEPKDLSR